MSRALRVRLDTWLADEIRDLAKARRMTMERYVISAVLSQIQEDWRKQSKAKAAAAAVSVHVRDDDGGNDDGDVRQ
jgi:hypothetical protein